MKRIFIPLALLSGAFAHSQVGIGTPEPNTSAELDITSTDKGILIPRVALEDLTDTTTIINGNVNCLIVFNTNETTDLQPYYWFNDRWQRMLSQNDDIVKERWKNPKYRKSSIFGAFNSSNETRAWFEGKNGAGIFVRLV